MATEEAEEDTRRRRHRRHRDSTAHRRRDEDYDEPASLPTAPADEAFHPPDDQAALRAARLKAMTTPTTARNKMKIEYQYTRPVKSPATARYKPPRTSSAGLFGRRASVLAVRPKSTTAVSTNKDSKDDGYQYVYKSNNPSMVDRRDFQTEHDRRPRRESQAPPVSRKTVASTTDKPKIQRRKTEPAVKVRRLSTATARPPARKSTTSVKASEVQIPEPAPAPKPAKLATAASAETSSEKPPKPQRTSSVLGSFFAKPAPVPEKQVSCLTCGSDTIPRSKSAKLPCDHRMCHSCLKRIFKMSVKDPAHMPPRCCTKNHIDLKHVDDLFSSEFKKTWNKKFEEYTTKNRMYCPSKGCGEWIQPKHIRTEQGRKVGVCPQCKLRVCTICNQKAHRSRECPKDPAMKQLNEIAEQQGWRKCFNCAAMVELKEGCNHMTCRCMAEFCMVCGLKWKSCDCPWFNYEAVDDLRGNPIRYQQEMDRRREQMLQDEQLARQMAGVGGRDRTRRRRANVADFELRNPHPNQMDAEFLQRAQDALAANFQEGDVAARGLLDGWLAGQENVIPPMPGAFDNPIHNPPPVFMAPAGRRRTQRHRHAPAEANPQS